jgi:hypothetical protein
MSRFASHEPEALAGLQLEQPLDFELCFGGSGKRNSQVDDGLPLRLFPLECGLDEHEPRASQDAIDQKEILETVCVYRRNPPPFHSNVLPARFGMNIAQGKTCTGCVSCTSELWFLDGANTSIRSSTDMRPVPFWERVQFSKKEMHA